MDDGGKGRNRGSESNSGWGLSSDSGDGFGARRELHEADVRRSRSTVSTTGSAVTSTCVRVTWRRAKGVRRLGMNACSHRMRHDNVHGRYLDK